MAAVDHSKSPRSARKSARLAVSPDLSALLGRFSNARAVIEVACRAQETGERYTEETTALRVGLTMLDSAYDELDRAIDLLRIPVPAGHSNREIG